ncbi:MAG: sulfotransferase family 2 domain-containing protein [Deltaproteobacteria bacterium]|nr:sulfotransferase family 2 domain-containing protein [Deltaproteobacteria bacterium]
MKVAIFKRKRKPVIGTLGWITATEIQGWAFYPNRTDVHARLEVRVNSQFAGSITADIYRSGLQERNGHPTGKCGYRFEFASPLQLGDKVEVFDVESGIPLGGSPGHHRFFLQRRERESFRIRRAQGENLKLFFIHVPKTAGTTFRHMLYDRFEQEEIYPNSALIREKDGYPSIGEFISAPRELLQSPILFHGHYPWVMHQLLGDNVHKLVFLREPVSRTVSNLNHFKNLNPNHRDLSLHEIYAIAKRHMSNLQTRYFCKSDINEDLSVETPRTMTQAHLDNAVRNLETCEFIGITECFDESIELVNRLYDFNFSAVKSMNVTKQKQEVSESFLDELRDDNKFDVALYEYGLRLFQKRLSRSS